MVVVPLVPSQYIDFVITDLFVWWWKNNSAPILVPKDAMHHGSRTKTHTSFPHKAASTSGQMTLYVDLQFQLDDDIVHFIGGLRCLSTRYYFLKAAPEEIAMARDKNKVYYKNKDFRRCCKE